MKIEEELSLRDFFTILRRRRRAFFICWGTVFAGALGYTWMVTPLYKAQTTFQLHIQDNPNLRETGVQALIKVQPEDFNIDQLLSSTIVQESIRRLQPSGHLLNDAEVVNETVRIMNMANIQYTDRDHQIGTLTILSPKPQETAVIANRLMQVIHEQVSEEATAKTVKTRTFIENQLKEVEARLRESEDRLREYQQKLGPRSTENVLISRLMVLRAQRTEMSKKFTSEFPELKQINEEIKSIEGQLLQMPSQEVNITREARDIRLNEELYSMLVKRLEEARIMESAHVSPLTILDPAVEPTNPDYPNKRNNLILGSLLGLFLGLVWVLARQHFDTSMVSPEEIEAYLQLPVLATIPHIERRFSHYSPPTKPKEEGQIFRRRDKLGEARSRLAFNYPPQSPFVEVYHILRNNLFKGSNPQQSHVFLFTSSVVSEGKSLTSANFCIGAAQAGIPTLLVETDLRKPMVDKLFNIPPEPGVTDFFYLSPRWETYLSDWETIKRCNPTLDVEGNASGLANLRILTSGKLPPNPVSLLSSERFAALIQEMRQKYPLIVLDGAPAMLFADSAMLGRLVDGIVLVYRFGKTPREILSRAQNQLTATNGKILGVVVNDIIQASPAYYHNYYSMYSSYENEHHRHYRHQEAGQKGK